MGHVKNITAAQIEDLEEIIYLSEFHIKKTLGADI